MSSFAQDGGNDEKEIVWIDPSSHITFLIDKRTGHSHPRTPLSRDSDEDNAQEMCSARRTIACTEPEDRVGEPPQWILNALKVRTTPADSILKLTSAM
jgi:hypothetical protein